MNDIVEFAKRMKGLREQMGLTQAQLGEKVGVSAQTISSYEKNIIGDKGKVPTLDKAIAIASVLDVSLDWLCGVGDTPNKKAISTLGDVALCLNEVSSWENVIVSEECQTKENFSLCAPGIIFLDGEIGSFLVDRSKMRQLLNENTFSQEFYDRWLADRIRSLNETTIADYVEANSLPF